MFRANGVFSAYRKSMFNLTGTRSEGTGRPGWTAKAGTGRRLSSVMKNKVVNIRVEKRRAGVLLPVDA